MYKAVHVIKSLDVQLGGASVSVPELLKATDLTDRYENNLIHFTHCGHETPLPPADDTNNSVHVNLPWRPLSIIGGQLHDGKLAKLIRASDIVQIHGIWQTHSVATGLLAGRYRKPFLVSAHGMLEPWALRNKWWKKAPYAALFERPNLRKAACLRALTRQEAIDYRNFGVRVPIAIIPNGVTPHRNLDPAPFLDRYPNLIGKRVILFLGRIHYKKGVDILCEAWARLHASFPDAHLVLAGPDFEDTRSRVEAAITRDRLCKSVTLTGMLNFEEKWSALACAHAFTLPSYSEGFSVAILEALAAGLPVIITNECHFPEVAENHCGWVIRPEVEDLTAALSASLSLPTRDRFSMAKRAEQLIADRYTWPRLGKMMADTYDWVLGGPLPTSTEIIVN